MPNIQYVTETTPPPIGSRFRVLVDRPRCTALRTGAVIEVGCLQNPHNPDAAPPYRDWSIQTVDGWFFDWRAFAADELKSLNPDVVIRGALVTPTPPVPAIPAARPIVGSYVVFNRPSVYGARAEIGTAVEVVDLSDLGRPHSNLGSYYFSVRRPDTSDPDETWSFYEQHIIDGSLTVITADEYRTRPRPKIKGRSNITPLPLP